MNLKKLAFSADPDHELSGSNLYVAIKSLPSSEDCYGDHGVVVYCKLGLSTLVLISLKNSQQCRP